MFFACDASPPWAALALCAVCLSPAVGLGQSELPPYPWVDNTTFVVDEAQLAVEAATYCAAESEPNAVDFYLGTLPYETFDALCLDVDADTDVLLGNLYISGYFGGLWLRDALYEAPARLSEAHLGALEAQYGLAHGDFGANMSTARGPSTEGLLIRSLAALAGRPIDRAQSGGDTEVVLAARSALPMLLTLYGYNLGYIQVLLENPPPGDPTHGDALDCGEGFLDCSSEDIELDIFDAYAPVLSSIENPTSPRWRRVAGLVETYGEPAVASGQEVWNDILAEDDIAAQAYGPLVDVSIGFLMVTDAAVLAGADAWGDGSVEAARCALRLQAGLVVWSGSYFMGLASDDPPGTFPELNCQ